MPDYGAVSRWIWKKQWEKREEAGAYLALFRRSISLERVPESCVLRISADSRYKFYVNGKKAAFGPAKGDDKVRYYDTVEISPFLQEGENVLSVEVLRYPVGHGKGNYSIFRAEHGGLYIEELPKEGAKEPVEKLWEEMNRDAEEPVSGGRLGISADKNWHARIFDGFSIVPEPGGFAPLQYNEKISADPSLSGWKMPGYQEGEGWEEAENYNDLDLSRGNVPGNILPRPIPAMKQVPKRFSGVKKIRGSLFSKEDWDLFLQGEKVLQVPAHTKEVVEITAGEEECGFLQLSLSEGEGAKVHILCSESYCSRVEVAPDGQQHPVKGDREDAEGGQLSGYTDEYTVAGAGKEDAPETYEPFWFRTFRFIRLEIETKDAPLSLLGFSYEETGYPLEIKAKVQTSDDSLSGIWDISKRTLERCMHETYMDCPFYEQLQYAMDSRNQILYTYASSMDDTLAKNCMEDFRRSQRYDGLLNCSYPNCETNVIPGFSIFYILMLHDHMLYFGEKDFLKRHLGCVDGILSYFDGKLMENGLLGQTGGIIMTSRYWSFIDWTDQWNDTAGVPDAIREGAITMESLLYLLGLQAAAEVFSFVGRKSTAEEYKERAVALSKVIRELCLSENGSLTDGPGVEKFSQHAQVFGVLTGVLSKEEGRAAIKKTLDHKEDYAQCSVAMAYYLFTALEETGLYEYTDSLWDVWRGMLEKNLTTCVEDPVTGRSDCHAWGSLALYELPSRILGVRPAAPGYQKIKICPAAGKLDWAKGDVPVRQGMVHVEWKKDENGKLLVEYQVPEGVEVVGGEV